MKVRKQAAILMSQNKFCVLFCLFVGVLLAQATQDCDDEQQATFHGNCYNFFVNDTEHAATYTEAKARCNNLDGSNLVSVESAQEQTFLEQEVTSRKGDKQQWRFWTSGEGKYDRWKWINDNQPLGLQGCFAFSKGSPSRRCPILSTFVSPEDCQEQCRRRTKCGSIRPTTAAVYKIESAIACVCLDDAFWKGASYSDQCTVPCPGDNSTLCGGNRTYHVYNIKGTYTAWANTSSGATSSIVDKTCAKIDREAGFLWKMAKCSDVNGYICQSDIQNGGLCLSSFTNVGGSCIHVNTKPNTWFNARMACDKQGATLVSIRHDGLQEGLEKLLSGNVYNSSSSFWIGATSFTWKWRNGNDILYTDWLGDNPNLMFRDMFVAMVYDASKNDSNNFGWGTLPDSEYYPCRDGYICEKEGPKTTTTFPATTRSRDVTKTVLGTTSSHTGKPPILLTTSSLNDTPIDPGFQTGDKVATLPGAAIGAIIVLAIIIIIVIVVATIIIKRRKQGTGLATPNGSVSAGFGNPMTDPSINTGDSRAVPNNYEVPSSTLRNQPVNDAVTYRTKEEKVETPTLQRASFENPCYRSYDDILDATGNDIYELEMPAVDIDGNLALYDNNQPDENVYDNNNR